MSEIKLVPTVKHEGPFITGCYLLVSRGFDRAHPLKALAAQIERFLH